MLLLLLQSCSACSWLTESPARPPTAAALPSAPLPSAPLPSAPLPSAHAPELGASPSHSSRPAMNSSCWSPQVSSAGSAGGSCWRWRWRCCCCWSCSSWSRVPPRCWSRAALAITYNITGNMELDQVSLCWSHGACAGTTVSAARLAWVGNDKQTQSMLMVSAILVRPFCQLMAISCYSIAEWLTPSLGTPKRGGPPNIASNTSGSVLVMGMNGSSSTFSTLLLLQRFPFSLKNKHSAAQHGMHNHHFHT